MKLTDKVVAGLTCGAGKKDETFGDDALKGFWVRVQANGTKTFLFRYKIGTASRRIPLGTFGEITAAQARKKAETLRGSVLDGQDPWAERKATRAEAIAAKAEAAFTLEQLISDFARLHLTGKRPSYRNDVVGRLHLHLKGLLATPAASVTKRQAVQAIDHIATNSGITTARRVLQYARTVYTWATRRGALDANPFATVPAPGKVVFRERSLTAEEVGLVWRAAGRIGTPYGPCMRFLLLTLARRDEVAGMTWGEVSPDLSLWTLPAERAKNSKGHVVHLAPAAQEILQAIGRGKDGVLVFGTVAARTAPGEPIQFRKLNSFAFIKRGLDREIAKERQEAAEAAGQPTPPPLPGWVMHDFRRSGVTALAEMGFPPHVADKLLNHTQGTIRGVAAIYQRGQFMEERKRALEAWAAHVLACAEGKQAPSNVVRLEGRGG